MEDNTKQEIPADLEKQLGSINDIKKFLDGRLDIWNFGKLLTAIYREEEPLGERLRRKLSEYDSDGNPENTARKIRNWLCGRNMPSNREELFRICFALGLDEKNTGILLGTTVENGIHFRNPKELIYAYCLRAGIDYPQAVSLVGELWKEPLPLGTLDYQEYVRRTKETECCNHMTASVRNRFKGIQTEEGLRSFMNEYRAFFGYHHNTAYRKFTKMLECLLLPMIVCDALPLEGAYSIEKVVDEYLRAGMPYDKRSSGNTILQKKIKEHWPTAKGVREMYSRKLDVNRKTLILLYVATEGMMHVHGKNPEVWLREHYKRLDLMLADCGMAALNLHSPFDFLILQAIHKENEDDFMSCRLDFMIRKIFPKEGTAAYIVPKI
jgi:hypothetical protein